MRQVSWAFAAAAALMTLGAPVAEAGITCKVIPSWCPADDHNGKNKNIHVGFERPDSHSVPHSSVPEPASLLLLGMGVTAVGATVARRRKRNKGE